MKTIKQTRREARRLFRLCVVKGALNEERVRHVVQSAIETKRRGSLALLSQFLYLVRLDRARHTAEIESAAPLPAEVQASIQAGLSRAYGPGITASYALNPALIGGTRIKVGSDVYDGSVRARLTALEKGF